MAEITPGRYVLTDKWELAERFFGNWYFDVTQTKITYVAGDGPDAEKAIEAMRAVVTELYKWLKDEFRVR